MDRLSIVDAWRRRLLGGWIHDDPRRLKSRWVVSPVVGSGGFLVVLNAARKARLVEARV